MQIMSNDFIIVSIEGNIGSGKSTFCRLFAEKYNNIEINNI